MPAASSFQSRQSKTIEEPRFWHSWCLNIDPDSASPTEGRGCHWIPMEVLAHFTANTACHLNIRVAGNSQVINMKRRLKKHSKTKENKETLKVKSMIITVWIPRKYMQTQKYFPSRCETVRQDVWATHHLSWSLWPPEALRFYSILRVTSMWLTSVQYTSIQVWLVYKCTVYIHYIYI